MTHCPGCSGTSYDSEIDGQEAIGPNSPPCPGCPDCADAQEWHRVIMAETCGEDEKHCACVPILRARIRELEAATRRVVEAMWNTYKFLTADEAVDCGVSAALADPVLVALRRE